MKQTKAQLRAKERYNKSKTKTYCLRLNKETDKDVIEILESQDSKQGYIKALIRLDYRLHKVEDIIDNLIDNSID